MTKLIRALLYAFGFLCLAAAILTITVGQPFCDFLAGIMGC